MIAKGAVAEFLNRKLDNFSWMKQLLREQLLSEIRKLEMFPGFVDNVGNDDPWLHQLVCYYLGACHPRFLYLLDMGLGKTRVILDQVSLRKAQKRFKHGLILVPRIINTVDWVDDAARWSNLTITPCIGSIEEKWDRLHRGTDLAVLDYHGMQLVLSGKEKMGKGHRLIPDEKRVAQLMKQYNFIAPDEIHKATGREGIRARLMYRLTRDAEFFYGATGTPFGRNVEVLWALFYLLDRGASMGDSLGFFRSVFMTEKQSYFGGMDYVFDKRMYRDLYRCVYHRSIRYDENECADLPPLVPKPLHLTMEGDQRTAYLAAVDELTKAVESRSRYMEAPYIRLRQIVAGYMDYIDESGVRRFIKFANNPKLDALEGVDESLAPDAKGIIYYMYTRTGEIIVERLKKLGRKPGWLYSGTKDQIALRQQFKVDPEMRWLVAQVDVAGLNLQHAQYEFFYETPSDPTMRKQAVKRVHRSGQTKTVWMYDAIMKGTIDIRIQTLLKEGQDLQKLVLEGKMLGTRLRQFLLPED